MRKNIVKKQINKEKIISAASKVYREYGINGIGIAALAKTVGLTHGSFYKQFPEGKEQLVSEVIINTFDQHCAILSKGDSLFQLIESYLSQAYHVHRDESCPIPTLGADVARIGGSVSQAFTDGVQKMLAVLTNKTIHQSIESEQRALQILSSIAGTLLITGAINNAELIDKLIASTINLWCRET